MNSATATLRDLPVTTLAGEATRLSAFGDGPILVVNVASRCGSTPQYAGLERLAQTYGPAGLTVLGVPCNQFGAQEPGTSEEIQTFCSTTYGVTFPLLAKVDVNGPARSPLFAELTTAADSDGYSGDVRWNFEKFLVGRDGAVLARFGTKTEPESPELLAALTSALA